LDGLRKVTVWDLGPGGRQWVIEREVENQVVLWPEGRPDQEQMFTGIERLNGACFSPDGRWVCLLTGPMPGVSVWEAGTGRKSVDLPFRHHADAQFSPDGRWLVTGTDAEYRLWSAGDWHSQRAWPAEQAGRSAGMIAFSPDGRFVALAQGPNLVQLRDTRDYDELVRLELPTALAVGSLGWSPDSTRLYVLAPGHRLFYWALPDLRKELAKLGVDWEHR
jgi:WD40 repeat protein